MFHSLFLSRICLFLVFPCLSSFYGLTSDSDKCMYVCIAKREASYMVYNPPHRRIANMRQEESIASSSCNCVLVSSVKSSLNTGPKCSTLKSNNKKKSGKGLAPSLDLSPDGRGHPSALDLSSLPLLKLKSGYALDPPVDPSHWYTCHSG